MGEEEKKPEEKKEEEAKKAVEEKKSETPVADGEKGKDGNKEAKKAEEEAKESKDPPPPTPPPEIILRVYMHCEGCARKVRRCLKGFEGVEKVETDCKTHKVVVKGEKADPLKVLERVQRKSHRQVELLSPIPKPKPPEEPKKAEDKEVVKPEEKKEEPQVINVVLKVHMHCEACAQEIRRRIHRMKGVESAEPDLKSSQVTVKGAFEPQQLIDFIYKRTGKQAVIVQVEPEKKEEEKAKEEGKEEKKAEEVEKDAKKAEEDGKGQNDGGNNAGDQPAKTDGEQEDLKSEMKKSEFYYNYPQNYQLYHPRFVQQEPFAYHHPYPPQIFSDENPNACSVM